MRVFFLIDGRYRAIDSQSINDLRFDWNFNRVEPVFSGSFSGFRNWLNSIWFCSTWNCFVSTKYATFRRTGITTARYYGWRHSIVTWPHSWLSLVTHTGSERIPINASPEFFKCQNSAFAICKTGRLIVHSDVGIIPLVSFFFRFVGLDGRKRAVRNQRQPTGVDRSSDSPEETQALLEIPDARTGKGVFVQRLCVEAETLGAGA